VPDDDPVVVAYYRREVVGGAGAFKLIMDLVAALN
jgi:hypothetical protein